MFLTYRWIMIVANHAFLLFCLVYMEIGTCKSSYVLKVYNNHLLNETCFVLNFPKPNVVLEGDLTLYVPSSPSSHPIIGHTRK
jgi:hypothetical protein